MTNIYYTVTSFNKLSELRTQYKNKDKIWPQQMSLIHFSTLERGKPLHVIAISCYEYGIIAITQVRGRRIFSWNRFQLRNFS